MGAIKAHFQGEADEYDEIIAKTIPNYMDMLDALVSAIPFSNEAKVNIIDLGSGTGNLSLRVRERYPHAQLTCLDLSQRMLEACRNRLGDRDVRYMIEDFSAHRFDEGYDAVASSLALHHLEAGERARFFARVYKALGKGGVFLNADIVLSGSPLWQERCLGEWEAYMGLSYPGSRVEEILGRYRAEDRPPVLLEDLKRLEGCGFRNPETFWKRLNFAVYGATK
jgi:tRNA (cmo5U34)-methyltransferase